MRVGTHRVEKSRFYRSVFIIIIFEKDDRKTYGPDKICRMKTIVIAIARVRSGRSTISVMELFFLFCFSLYAR